MNRLRDSVPHYLITLRPGRPNFPATITDEEKRVVAEHFAYYEGLCKAGKALLVGRTDEREPLGLALLMVADLQAAQEILGQDPAVLNGVMLGDVQPFRLALSKGGFGVE